ncbi:hypothetical protein RLOatenuis_0960 [Rickettsiales bacterium]|nr:hypothetical protein RLOatenuis_0960 [Rickettsiales bacterium]
MIKWLEHNRKYAEVWPNITEVKKAYPGADKFKNTQNKLKSHFNPEPFRQKEE